jgi:hypothetical protein
MSKGKTLEMRSITCAGCGSALQVPANTKDTAILRCEICQGTIGTWAEVKAEAARKDAEDRRLRVGGVH